PATSTAHCSTSSWRRRFTSRRLPRPSPPQQETDATPCDDRGERQQRAKDLSPGPQALQVLSSSRQKKRARTTTVKQRVRHSMRAHAALHPPLRDYDRHRRQNPRNRPMTLPRIVTERRAGSTTIGAIVWFSGLSTTREPSRRNRFTVASVSPPASDST